MKFAPLFVLAALLLAGCTSPDEDAPPPATYPAEFVALLPGWIAAAESLVQPGDSEKSWWADADRFLQGAKKAGSEGRVRVAMFDLETFTEVVLSNRLADEAASLGSDAERRTFVTQRTAAWKEDSDRAWLEYREALHGYDDELRSLHSLEKAIYSADVAITGRIGSSDYEAYAKEFPKQPGFDRGHVLELTRRSHTPGLAVGWAKDLLAEAVKAEGVPPRIVEEKWNNLTAYAVSIQGDTSPFLEELTKLAEPARANGEEILSVTFTLAEQRTLRLSGMHTMFGDAGTRGLDVTSDASRSMRIALRNTSMAQPLDRGLVGVFTADALDRAALTNDLVAKNQSTLGTVLVAWASLDHAAYVDSALGTAGPHAPKPDPSSADDKRHPVGEWWDGYRYRQGRSDFDYYLGERAEDRATPFVPLAGLVGLAALAALARRSR